MGDQEAAIRNHTYVDPQAGQITLIEWVNQWYPSLDLELTTLNNYRYLIEVRILPAFGHRALASLTKEEIATWEIQLAQNGYSRRTSGVYGHVSSAKRAELCGALQERWDAALRDRAGSAGGENQDRLPSRSQNRTWEAGEPEVRDLRKPLACQFKGGAEGVWFQDIEDRCLKTSRTPGAAWRPDLGG
jgi:Phage integrase, N-terminal SAM-like domain